MKRGKNIFHIARDSHFWFNLKLSKHHSYSTFCVHEIISLKVLINSIVLKYISPELLNKFEDGQILIWTVSQLDRLAPGQSIVKKKVYRISW